MAVVAGVAGVAGVEVVVVVVVFVTHCGEGVPPRGFIARPPVPFGLASETVRHPAPVLLLLYPSGGRTGAFAFVSVPNVRLEPIAIYPLYARHATAPPFPRATAWPGAIPSRTWFETVTSRRSFMYFPHFMRVSFVMSMSFFVFGLLHTSI